MSNPNKVGIVFAVLLGGIHLLWSVLIALGVAQSFYDFVLWAHMIHLPLVVGPFDMTASVVLVLMTAVMGYLVGNVGARVWNRLHR